MLKPRAVNVLSTDGERNVSRAAWRAWKDPGSDYRRPFYEVFAYNNRYRVRGNRVDGAAAETLTETQVKSMLTDTADWSLVVSYDDKKGILDREALRAASDIAAGETGQVQLVDLQSSDTKLIADADAILNPAGTVAKLSEGIKLPLTTGLLTAAATAFGLLGNTVITRTWCMWVAVGFGVASVVLALLASYWHKTVRVKINRLNELSAAVRRAQRSWPALACAGLVVGGLLFTLAAVLPASQSKPSARITGRGVEPTAGGGFTVGFTVSYKNLPDAVTKVRATLADGNTQLTFREDDAPGDGTASNTFQNLQIPKPTTLTVTPQTLDAGGRIKSTLATLAIDIP
jgi:hypothetical protein